MSNNDFSIDVGRLRVKAKDYGHNITAKLDHVAEENGFVDRTPKKKRGRPASPRTGQVHAKVLPGISEAIAHEAKRRGVQQGVLIEEAWELYVKNIR